MICPLLGASDLSALERPAPRLVPAGGLMGCTQAGVERAMKIQEVILKALSRGDKLVSGGRYPGSQHALDAALSGGAGQVGVRRAVRSSSADAPRRAVFQS